MVTSHKLNDAAIGSLPSELADKANVSLNNLNSTGKDRFVTKDTTQTISGAKTFTQRPEINKNRDGRYTTTVTEYALGDTPASNYYTNGLLKDKNGVELAQCYATWATNGNRAVNLWLRKDASTTVNVISATVTNTGEVYAQAKTPSDTTSTSSTQIATTGWVNSTGNNVVHRSGNETISGVKTFTGENNTFTNTVIFSKTADAIGTSDNGPALIVGGTRTTSHVEIDNNEIIAKSNATTGGPLYLNNDGGGTVIVGSGGLTSARSLSSTQNDTQVATTAWVRSRVSAGVANCVSKTELVAVKVVISEAHSGTEWYRKWSDGWIEQGGECTVISGGYPVSLSQAYSDTNYTVISSASKTGSAQSSYVTCIFNKSTTGFTLSGNAVGVVANWYACGY